MKTFYASEHWHLFLMSTIFQIACSCIKHVFYAIFKPRCEMYFNKIHSARHFAFQSFKQSTWGICLWSNYVFGMDPSYYHTNLYSINYMFAHLLRQGLIKCKYTCPTCNASTWTAVFRYYPMFQCYNVGLAMWKRE